MKVLLTTLHNPQFAMGGAEQIMLDTCLGVRHLGVEIACAVNAGELADRLQAAKVPVYFLEWSKLKTLKTIGVLKEAIKIFQPDIIHAFHRYPPFLIETFLKRKAGMIFTDQVFHRDKRLFFRYGDFAVGCHESVRKNLVEFYGVPENRSLTIPNAVHERRVDTAKLETLKKRYPPEPGKITALFVGRLHEQKGHAYLIEAAALLPEKDRKKIRIFLAGDGPLGPALQAQVKEKKLESVITFLGHVREIPEWLAYTDFVLLPSLWEGLPLVIMEAYSAHKAVLATAIDGNRDSVKPGETGELVPPRDPQALAKALSGWIEHPEKAAVMGGKAYLWWQKEFSVEKMIRANFELYQKLLRERERP